MTNLDIRSILPMLQQFGITPEQLGPDKLEKIMQLGEHLQDPSDITPEVSRQVLEVLGISTRGAQVPVKRKGQKIGRNEPCPCEKGKKYKKCCGQDQSC